MISTACGILLLCSCNESAQEKDAKSLSSVEFAVSKAGLDVSEKRFFESMEACRARLNADIRQLEAEGYQAQNLANYVQTQDVYAFAALRGPHDGRGFYCVPDEGGRAAFFAGNIRS